MRASPRPYALLHKRLEQFRRMLHGLEAGEARALHRTRVASRRLREALPVLQLDPAVANKLGRRLRKVTQRLGGVRELDVMLHLVEELDGAGHYDPRSLATLASAIAADRVRARERLENKLPIEDLHDIADRLSKIADELNQRDRPAAPKRADARSWRWAIDARIARRAASLGAAIRDAGTVYLPDRLHAVRIALKKLRYALELAAEVAGEKGSSDLRTLKRVQGVLGRMHDFQVLIDRVRHVQNSLPAGEAAVRHDLDAVLTALENSCRRLHGRFMRDRDEILAICERAGGSADSRTAIPPRRAVAG